MSEYEYQILKKKADRLAYAVAKLVMNGGIDTRSKASDELLLYLSIGGINSPESVPQWMKQYEKESEAGK